MHISDGVLPIEVVVITSVTAGALVLYSLKSLKEEEIPKISLMTATFFVLSLVSIPIGPSSIHPLLCAVLGIILGWRSPLAVFIGLLLQAILFQHGGLTTLGANTLMVAIPAIISHQMFHFWKGKTNKIQLLSFFVGGLAVILALLILILILVISSSFYYEGTFSVIRLLLVGHIPLMLIEALLTGFIIRILLQVRPNVVLGHES